MSRNFNQPAAETLTQSVLIVDDEENRDFLNRIFKALDQQVTAHAVSVLLGELKDKYQGLEKVTAYLADAGAAILLPQPELSDEALARELQRLGGDRGMLLAMANRARELAVTDAAQQVARLCLEAAA